MASIADIGSSARDVVGRYFSLVSAVPSAFLIVWIILLVGSGAWSGRPNAGRAVSTVAGIGVGDAAGLVLATLFLGLVLHPLQYAFVQALEGYWGTSAVTIAARAHRAEVHWRRLVRRREVSSNANAELDARTASGFDDDEQVDREVIRLTTIKDENTRVTRNNPEIATAVMPTRLGNILRYYETKAGAPYNLRAVTVLPYISRVAGAGDMEYVNDQRSAMDLAVRMVVVSALAFALAVIVLLPHGFWLLIALFPYSAAYLSYRGAVIAAAEYGRALGVVIALNRFALYDRLKLAAPQDTQEERESNERLNLMLNYASHAGASMGYDVGPSATGTPPTYR